jgi:hypothetical protein
MADNDVKIWQSSGKGIGYGSRSILQSSEGAG